MAVTTYDTIKNPKLGEALKHSIMWRYVVLDEAHKVKNEDSLISIAMRKINRQHTLMLTGGYAQEVMCIDPDDCHGAVCLHIRVFW